MTMTSMSMLQESLLADLSTHLPAQVRLHKIVNYVRRFFGCGAVVLLKKEQSYLTPVAQEGLMKEAFGRRFELAQHPRLAMICNAREALRFEPSSELPDPYDGLIEALPQQPLAVHDCMGMPLFIEGILWGAITLDALTPGTFNEESRADLHRCALLLEAALRVTRIENDNKALRQNHQDSVALETQLQGETQIIGHSSKMLKTLEELDMVAKSDLPVLLLGETGTGKELFAQRLHKKSLRAKNTMAYVNCAALPESLAESELFGHCKGAFSGASHNRQGRFESADGGTIFLDEVGELPLSIQAKLLRVIQNGEVQRLGSDQTRRVDVRIVAATNRDLQAQIKAGEFRADLYHRLSVYPLPIPPLREREEDVLLIAGYFLEQNRARLGFRSLRLASQTELALKQYHWPGNVRELEHMISRAAIRALSAGHSRAGIVTLTPEYFDDLSNTSVAPVRTREQVSITPLREAVENTQRELIYEALQQANQCWSSAATLLQMDASNLHKLARRLGLKKTSESIQ